MHSDVLVVEGGDSKRFADALEGAFPARRYTTKSGGTEVLVFEEYYFRTSSYLSATIVLDQEDSASCRVEIVSSGGGAGALLIDWGARRQLSARFVALLRGLHSRMR